MQEIFEDSRITYLMGNHEELFLDYIKNDIQLILDVQRDILERNQAYKTLKNYQKLSQEEKEKLIYNLKTKLAYKTLYINKDNKKVFLCHSGVDYKDILSDKKELFI